MVGVTKTIYYDKKNNRIVSLIFRVILGLTLFIKGVSFIRNKVLIETLISKNAILEKLTFLNLLIPFIHILGGFFILIGIYTRIAILIQIPIIIAAIIFLFNSGSDAYPKEIAFAVTILIMLVVYLKFGDGFYSWKNLINKEKDIL
jgi:uncharacterized membrane protein YphA (DoxX/SURF4 family)